jgi:hypothetical protein
VTTSSSTKPLAGLLDELGRRGVELAVGQGNLRYRPRGVVTALLAQRIAEHKAALLSLLRDAGTPMYSLPELAVLARAGLGPADVPMVGAAKSALTDLGGLTVLAVGLPDPQPPSSPHHLPDAWRECFEERAGIMEFVGNLARERAEALALTDIAALMVHAGCGARHGHVPSTPGPYGMPGAVREPGRRAL